MGIGTCCVTSAIVAVMLIVTAVAIPSTNDRGIVGVVHTTCVCLVLNTDAVLTKIVSVVLLYDTFIISSNLLRFVSHVFFF
jgi:hypothetical protein